VAWSVWVHACCRMVWQLSTEHGWGVRAQVLCALCQRACQSMGVERASV